MTSSTDQRPRLRVCIIAKATPFIWVHHYVNAFRAVCDVITVGSALTPNDLAETSRTHLAHLVTPNDIDHDIAHVSALVEALPEGWRPDLIVTIQSGVPQIESIDWVSCPTAYISVDTWHDFAELFHARPYDFVFAAQREFAAHFSATGSAHAHWLPLACDPAVHRPVECRKDYDIAFVGSIERSLHAQRVQRLEQLAERYSVVADTALGGDEMARAYARARLAFNSSVAQDVNMRVFETLAMGVPLLTNRDADVNGLLDLFRDDEHLIAYDDSDLLARAERYLRDDVARQALAERGRVEALAHHTYAHRVNAILEVISAEVDWNALRLHTLMRDHGTLRDYIPTVPGRVALIEPCPGITEDVLTRAGTEHAVHIAFGDAQSGEGFPTDSTPFDTVVRSSGPQHTISTATLATVHTLLRSGGTLVSALSPDDMRALATSGEPADVWHAIEALGFPVIRMEMREAPDENGALAFVIARKQTRPLKEIAREIYTRNPIPGLSLEDALAQMS